MSTTVTSWSRRPGRPLSPAYLEAERLQALDEHDVLGRVESGLDTLAGIAAARSGQTLGAVSLVGAYTIWLAGVAGLPDRDLARDGSLCEEVVRSGLSLIVDDARRDRRFSAHELVAGPAAIRSYAGVPLCDGNGHVLGAIAAFSREPTAFDPSMADELEVVARVAARFLALRQSREDHAPERVQGWLGVRTAAWRGGIRRRSGLTVVSLARGSPAERAGLRPSDVLYALDARVLNQPADIVAGLAGRVAGEWVHLRFQRAGCWQDRFVEIEPQPTRPVRATLPGLPADRRW